MGAYWAGGDQLVSDRGLTPNDLIDPDTSSIDYDAASWSAASWSTATDPLAASWSAASWSCLGCSSSRRGRRQPDERKLERRRLGHAPGGRHERDQQHHERRSRLEACARCSARVVRSRPHRMLSGQAAIWALSGAMIAIAAVLFRAGAGDVPPIISSVHVPFWALVIAFAAAERFVVHVHFRRSAHSMSLGEIPFVFALVFAGGDAGDPGRRARPDSRARAAHGSCR